ncbi:MULTISPECIES: HAD family hydrolase [Lactobacillus]|uniref:HAD family hydrolase n=1 Tax=Lactobacillus xujianguonis TaxID=2495899 RepID=A0A437SV72_9LACO|nr:MULTISPECIES: HAD hydrolase-like protein [Lactobacillus]RVU70839.1 HAD family hydrolase [Lactobacillus xujianguonis]RVU77070.1 HAD family hydrolase [Lactobacillus xujianguonis]
MNTFESLIFVPEGTLLNQKLAERTALRQTLKAFNHEFGPAQRLKYSELTQQNKLLSQTDWHNLLLQTFFPENFTQAQQLFEQKIAAQACLNKESLEFLEKIHDQAKLILVGKEPQKLLQPRLQDSQLTAYFQTIYYSDNFTTTLPNKNIFQSIISQQQLDPDTSLIIGANLADEIQGAENTGLKSLWLAPKKEKIPITPHPTLHLSKLSDLLFYLNVE